MAIAEGFICVGNGSIVTADAGGGAAGLAIAIIPHWTSLKSVCSKVHRYAGTGLTMRPNTWKRFEPANYPRPNHYLLHGPEMDLEEKLVKRLESRSLHTKTVFGLRIHLEGSHPPGFGFTIHANTVLLPASAACKDGDLRVADPTHHITAWPKLSIFRTDLPDLSLNLCRSRPDLTVQEPRRQIGGYSHRVNKRFAYQMGDHLIRGPDPSESGQTL